MLPPHNTDSTGLVNQISVYVDLIYKSFSTVQCTALLENEFQSVSLSNYSSFFLIKNFLAASSCFVPNLILAAVHAYKLFKALAPPEEIQLHPPPCGWSSTVEFAEKKK